MALARRAQAGDRPVPRCRSVVGDGFRLRPGTAPRESWPSLVYIKNLDAPVVARQLLSIGGHQPRRRDESKLVGRTWELNTPIATTTASDSVSVRELRIFRGVSAADTHSRGKGVRKVGGGGGPRDAPSRSGRPAPATSHGLPTSWIDVGMPSPSSPHGTAAAG